MKKQDDNSLSNNHPLMLFAKSKSWIKLFLFPVFSAIILCGIIVSNSTFKWDDVLIILILTAGAIIGGLFATRMGKKHGLIEIDTKVMESKDIDELVTKRKKQDEP